MARRRRTKKAARKSRKNQIPLAVLEKRQRTLTAIVKRRGGETT